MAKIYVELDGELINVKEYCRQKNLKYHSVSNRVKRYGETYEEALAYCENNPNCYYDAKPTIKLSKDDMDKLLQFANENDIKPKTIKAYVADHPYLNTNEIISFYKEKIHYAKMSNFRFYNIWKNMIARCYNPSNAYYENYGGRGIIVCDRWHDYRNFQDDLYASYCDHEKKFGTLDTTLDRFPDINGNYVPSNVRWATNEEQSRNRRNNIQLKTTEENLKAFCLKHNLPYREIWQRIKKYGWSEEKALNTPILDRMIKASFLVENETLAEYCRKNDKDYDIVRWRLNHGWSEEDALNKPKGYRPKNN